MMRRIIKNVSRLSVFLYVFDRARVVSLLLLSVSYRQIIPFFLSQTSNPFYRGFLLHVVPVTREILAQCCYELLVQRCCYEACLRHA